MSMAINHQGRTYAAEVTLTSAADTYTDAAGSATIVRAGAGADTIDAGDGDDLVYAARGDDYINGGTGADIIKGGHGADTILGGAGADRLIGEWGEDVIVLGGGNDICTGDRPGVVAADTFVFADTGGTTCTITDFQTGTDTLDFSEWSMASGGEEGVAVVVEDIYTHPNSGRTIVEYEAGGKIIFGDASTGLAAADFTDAVFSADALAFFAGA